MIGAPEIKERSRAASEPSWNPENHSVFLKVSYSRLFPLSGREKLFDNFSRAFLPWELEYAWPTFACLRIGALNVTC